MDDGSLNHIITKTQFNNSGFNTPSLLGNHILTNSYINSQIIQMCSVWP